MTSELRKFMGYSQQRANAVLNELADAGFLRKNYVDITFIEYWFVRNEENGSYLIMKGVERSKRTLGAKLR
jgi:hypothetical protein